MSAFIEYAITLRALIIQLKPMLIMRQRNTIIEQVDMKSWVTS